MNSYRTLLDALDDRREGGRTITFIEGAEVESVIGFDELHRRALSVLGRLQALGTRRAEPLILALTDNRAMVEAFWACLYGGLVPVPLAVGVTDDHRAKVFRIFDRLERPRLVSDARGWGRLEKYAAKKDAGGPLAALEAARIDAEELAKAGGAGEPVTATPEDLALIQFSSGSTREPKGIRLTHGNLVTNTVDLAERAEYGAGDVGLNWMPLTHDMGLIAFHLNFVVAGMSHHLMPTDLFSRRPLLWLAKAAEKRATILGSPNFGYKHYLKAFDARGDAGDGLDLSSVRLLMNGAEPISVPLAREFLDTLAPFGLRRSALQTVYGLAEATVGVAIPPPGREFEALRLDRRRLGVGDRVAEVAAGSEHEVEVPIEGPPFRRCQVRVVDAQGVELPERTVGHLEIRGPNVTTGFVGADAAARGADDWLDTGDLAFLDGGRVAITGRAKDIIFAFGQNFYPHDLEAAATEVDGVELGKVAAVGHRAPDGDRDQVLVFVLHRGRAAEFAPLAAAVAGRINERVGTEVDEVLPVRRIPKTTSGKLQRHVLERAYAAGDLDEVRSELARLRDGAAQARGASSNPHEVLVLEVTAEVISDRPVGLDDNLFEIGLSSLDLAQIHERLDERHPGVLDIMDLFDHPTLRQLAAFLAGRLESAPR